MQPRRRARLASRLRDRPRRALPARISPILTRPLTYCRPIGSRSQYRPEERMVTRAILDLPLLGTLGLLVVLVLGGSAKGALSIGLPLVSVPLTSQFLDLPVVIGLLTVPMIATNI